LDYSHKDEAVVQRVREMWDQNFMQKEMLATLQAEGYNVSASGLMRLRFKHNLHLKSVNSAKPALDAPGSEGDELTGHEAEAEDIVRFPSSVPTRCLTVLQDVSTTSVTSRKCSAAD